jgi:hypothetical protein
MIGLSNYLGTAGMIRELLPVKGDSLLPDQLKNNLLSKYRFRNFDNPNVYVDKTTASLYSTYTFLFLRLYDYYLKNGDKTAARSIFNTMELKLPGWRFPEEQNKIVLEFKKELDH